MLVRRDGDYPAGRGALDTAVRMLLDYIDEHDDLTPDRAGGNGH